MRPLVGEKFGRLIVLNPFAATKNKQAMCKCRCECGNEKDVAASYLRRGIVRSCGCLAREVTGNMSRRHGMSKTPEYAVWLRMRERCTNPKVERYPRYGGRGIRVCERWQEFENFLADMGRLPSAKHSLGRINNDGDYCPENCRWETRKEQANNTSANRFIEWKGEARTLAEWSDKTGVASERIGYRSAQGLDMSLVMKRGSLVERPIKFRGETRLTTEWMRHLCIPISSFYYHRRNGRSDTEILELYARG